MFVALIIVCLLSINIDESFAKKGEGLSMDRACRADSQSGPDDVVCFDPAAVSPDDILSIKWDINLNKTKDVEAVFNGWQECSAFDVEGNQFYFEGWNSFSRTVLTVLYARGLSNCRAVSQPTLLNVDRARLQALNHIPLLAAPYLFNTFYFDIDLGDADFEQKDPPIVFWTTIDSPEPVFAAFTSDFFTRKGFSLSLKPPVDVTSFLLYVIQQVTLRSPITGELTDNQLFVWNVLNVDLDFLIQARHSFIRVEKKDVLVEAMFSGINDPSCEHFDIVFPAKTVQAVHPMRTCLNLKEKFPVRYWAPNPNLDNWNLYPRMANCEQSTGLDILDPVNEEFVCQENDLRPCCCDTANDAGLAVHFNVPDRALFERNPKAYCMVTAQGAYVTIPATPEEPIEDFPSPEWCFSYAPVYPIGGRQTSQLQLLCNTFPKADPTAWHAMCAANDDDCPRVGPAFDPVQFLDGSELGCCVSLDCCVPSEDNDGMEVNSKYLDPQYGSYYKEKERAYSQTGRKCVPTGVSPVAAFGHTREVKITTAPNYPLLQKAIDLRDQCTCKLNYSTSTPYKCPQLAEVRNKDSYYQTKKVSGCEFSSIKELFPELFDNEYSTCVGVAKDGMFCATPASVLRPNEVGEHPYRNAQYYVPTVAPNGDRIGYGLTSLAALNSDFDFDIKCYVDKDKKVINFVKKGYAHLENIW